MAEQKPEQKKPAAPAPAQSRDLVAELDRVYAWFEDHFKTEAGIAFRQCVKVSL